MTWKQVFTSSIGKKIVMAVTGVFLIMFLIVHVGLNACIFAMDGGVMFNKAAHFMGHTVVIRIMEVGLFIGFFIHIIQGFVLWAQNSRTRNTGYAIKLGSRGSKWYSRSMGLLGTIIFLFLIIHWNDFWFKARFTGVEEININGSTVADMFSLMKTTFSNIWIVIIYVLGCISLAYHLMHGFQSAFRTLGVDNRKYVKMLQGLGNGYAIIVSLAFAMMPISMYLGWVK